MRKKVIMGLLSAVIGGIIALSAIGIAVLLEQKRLSLLVELPIIMAYIGTCIAIYIAVEKIINK